VIDPDAGIRAVPMPIKATSLGGLTRSTAA
jgi:hypothetical protein